MRIATPLLLSLLLLLLLCSDIRLGGRQIASVATANQQLAPETRIAFEPVATGLAQPVLVTNAGDGSRDLFILERAGVIKILRYGESEPTVFLDLTDRAMGDNLSGLLGLAFHPRYENNGRFFVHYLRRDDVVITAEYRVSGDPRVADHNSEKILLAMPKLRDGHMGGSVEFGPDGYLYVGMGDGSASSDILNNAQNLDSLLGKILRLDIDNPSPGKNYSSPPDNPFFGATPGRDEIWAYGFRNPYRLSFDPETGQLYVGEVGEAVKEEVNIVTRGGNYGWRVLEGTRCAPYDPALCGTIRSLPPLLEFNHADGWCAITGGYVYRGDRATFPQGAYIFGDLCSGKIYMYYNGQTQYLRDGIAFLSSFGIDEAGELYVANISNGVVYRMVIENPEDPVVQLLTPSKKMKLRGNTVYEITWATSGAGIYRHDIQWSKDGGANWEDIVGGLPGETRTYAWTVPNTKTSAARLRVISYGNRSTGQDESHTDFVIKKAVQ